jgi:DNA-binding MarR family transcriptional regulator
MHDAARHIADHCLLMRARRLARVATRTYVDEMAHLGLSVGQFSVLVAVGTQPGVRAADLVGALDLERSTLSRELAALVADGLVHTERVDGRSQALHLTDAGAARLDAALPAWERAQQTTQAMLGDLAEGLLTRFPPG